MIGFLGIFMYNFIFYRILCVLATFYQRGHFVIHVIKNMHLISVQSWTYLFGGKIFENLLSVFDG